MMTSTLIPDNVDEVKTNLFAQDNQAIDDLLSENLELRMSYEKQFRELYSNQNAWNSDKSLLLLEEILIAFKKKKSELEAMYDTMSNQLQAKPPLTPTKSDDQMNLVSSAFLRQALSTMSRLKIDSDVFSQNMNDYAASLLERKIMLGQYPDTQLRSTNGVNEIDSLATSSFANALTIFKNPMQRAAIKNYSFATFLCLYGKLGKCQTAGRAFAQLVLEEVTKRIHSKTLSLQDENIKIIKDALDSLNIPNDLGAQSNRDIELQAEVFKDIYCRLREKQGSYYMTNYLEDKTNWPPEKLIPDAKSYAEEWPNSRCAKAWELTQSFYGQYDRYNRLITKEIDDWVAQKIGFHKFNKFAQDAYAYALGTGQEEGAENTLVSTIRAWIPPWGNRG